MAVSFKRCTIYFWFGLIEVRLCSPSLSFSFARALSLPLVPSLSSYLIWISVLVKYFVVVWQTQLTIDWKKNFVSSSKQKVCEMRRPQYGHSTYVMCGTKLREFKMKTTNWNEILKLTIRRKKYIECEQKLQTAAVSHYAIWQPRNFRLVVWYAVRAYTHQFYAYTQNHLNWQAQQITAFEGTSKIKKIFIENDIKARPKQKTRILGMDKT